MRRVSFCKKVGLALLVAGSWSADALSITCGPGTREVRLPGFGPHRSRTVCVPLPPPPPQLECAIVHEGPHFGGAAKFLGPQQATNLPGDMISRRTWHGGFQQRWSGRDVSWDNNVSSVQVKEGCYLTLYDGVDLTGELKKFQGFAGADYSTISFDERTSSLACTCGSPTVVLSQLLFIRR